MRLTSAYTKQTQRLRVLRLTMFITVFFADADVARNSGYGTNSVHLRPDGWVQRWLQLREILQDLWV